MRTPKVKEQPADRRAGGASDADDALEGLEKGPEKGRGTLIYSTEPGAGTVHLHWQPQQEPSRDWAGPAAVIATTDFQSRKRHGILIGLLAFVALGAAGAAAGAFSGSTMAGLLSGLTCGYFVGCAVWVRSLQRALRAAQETKAR